MQNWFLSTKNLFCQIAETIMKINSMHQEPLIFRAKLRLKVLRHCRCCNELSVGLPGTQMIAGTRIHRLQIAVPRLKDPSCIRSKVDGCADFVVERRLLEHLVLSEQVPR